MRINNKVNIINKIVTQSMRIKIRLFLTGKSLFGISIRGTSADKNVLFS